MEEKTSPHEKELVTIAGGCFWCIQGPFDAHKAVSTVRVGYAGGSEESAEYYTVASGQSEHREAVQFEYDPSAVDYTELLEIFFRQIDPTDSGGQFADRGHQYTTAVYYHTDEQREAAEQFIKQLNASGKFDAPVATVVEPYSSFYEAEEAHQSYYKKNPLRYQMYKKGSGRADYIKNTWNE